MGGDVTIKVVNPPIVTRLPARPNVAVNVLAGFLAGLIVAGVRVARREGKIYKIMP